MTRTSKAAAAVTLANLDAAHGRAQRHAEIIGALRDARKKLQEQKDISADLIARRQRRVEACEEAATAAGIDLATLSDPI